MSAATLVPDARFPEAGDPCQIVVLSEDSTHQTAMDLCSRLLTLFEDDLAFAVHSWRLDELNNPTSTHRASNAAARADVLLIALHDVSSSGTIQKWLDGISTETRLKPEGALAVMVPENADTSANVEALLAPFRHTASRLHMDFLATRTGNSQGPSPASTPPSPRPAEPGRGYAHGGLNE